MKHRHILLSFLLMTSAGAQADWYLRGTHNSWGATPMNAAGTNTVELTNVVFTAAGSIKFDRYGNWAESYGVGGLNDSNISVGQGTWNIKFFTDTKNWSITSAASVNYHLRGTFNSWAEGTLLTRVGTSDVYESCQNFVSGDATGGPRFKIDPNGGWGSDAVPAADYTVAAGWVKISFNSSTKAITAQQNLAANCGVTTSSSATSTSSLTGSSLSSTASSAAVSSSVASTQFHLRGTHNGWVEGDLFATPSGANQLEICRNFSAGDASGGPRFKVDPNGGWGDAFPAADQAANGWTKIIINTSSRTLVSITANLATNCGTTTSSSTGSTSSVSTSISSVSSSVATADDFRARTMYFVFVDRFANGNTANDNGSNSAATSTVKSAGAQSEWKKYWGGDIAGLISKLDYLQSLGVSAIWVTPLVDNINVGNEGGYHGYWARDFYAVDEHLGDWALVDELDAQMEARGMKLVLDIALNHSNQDDQYEFGALYKEGAFLTDFASGKNTWYHANGAISDCGDTNPATTCNTEWDDPWSFRNKSLFNLTDFNHGTNSNSIADQYLIDAALKWMDHGVDAFRIDAIKHIEPSFINRFSAAVRAKKADTYIFGEWYNAGSGDSLSMSFLNERRGSELLDFKLRDAIENAIAGNIAMVNLSSHILSRPGAMNNFEDQQAIFLDNHDATRTSVYLQTTGATNRGTGKGMAKSFADARQNLGMALVMTLPGVPTIYYGTEQNSTWFTANGDGQVGHDPYNRELQPSFNQSTPAYALISSLANLRKNSIAIQRGTYAERWSTADILVFQRQEGSDCAVVAVNRGAAATITVPNLCLANAAYTSAVGTDVVNVTSGSGTFNLSQNEVVVLH